MCVGESHKNAQSMAIIPAAELLLSSDEGDWSPTTEVSTALERQVYGDLIGALSSIAANLRLFGEDS